MSNKNFTLIILLLLFSFVMVHASSCLLNKINTNLAVYANYEEDIQKLDIDTKLTYINVDTGEKKALSGKDLLITVNVTKNNGENVTIEKEVVTNGLGWAQRTFYLDDAKEYQVLVTFEGDSGFKESIGTIGGSGEFEQQQYTTNLPEGISLTTCLPIMILIGFLGAAMYASGGNPFGFVDMTTNRGFRMNKNLRKTMFVQGVAGTIGSYTVKGVQIAMNVLAGKKSGAEEKGNSEQKKNEDKSKENTKKEEVKSVDQKVATTSGVMGALQNGFLNKPQDKKSNEKKEEKGKEVKMYSEKAPGTEKVVEIKEKRASEAFYTASRWINIIGALFTGDSMLSVDRAMQISNLKVKQDKEKIFNKYVTLDSKRKEANETINNEKKVKEITNKTIKENKNKIEKINDKINELTVHGTSILDPKLTKLRELKKNVESENKVLEQEVKGIDKKIETAWSLLDKISKVETKIRTNNKEIKDEDIGKINIKTVDLFVDKKESKQITEEMNKIVETNCGLSNIINKLLNGTETNSQMLVNYALNNENGVKNLVEMDEKKLGLHNQMLVVGGKAIEEIERQNENLKKLQEVIKNPEQYNKIKEIKERIENGDVTKEDFAFFKNNRILFDENLQREVMVRDVLVIGENGEIINGRKGLTLEDRINEIDSIKTEYKEKIKNVEKEISGTEKEKIVKKLNEEMNEKIEIFSNNNEYIYENNNLIDVINRNKKQIFDALKDVNSTEYNSRIVEKALNPESNKEFAKDYKEMNYKEFRKKELEVYEREKEIKIKDEKEIEKKKDGIKEWEMETANKLAKNIDELVEKSNKKSTDKLIGEMVGEYEVMKQFNPAKDETFERSEKIKSIIDKEIVQVTKTIKSESSTAFSTQEEDANLGRLKKRNEFLNEEIGKLQNIEVEKKQEEFFAKKGKK